MKRKSPEEKIVYGLLAFLGKVFRVIFGVGNKKNRRRGRVSIDKEMTQSKWREIEELVEMGGSSRLKSAIVEADKLLDYALRANGFPGENLGERLKASYGNISKASYESAWQAHKLRNRLVHEIEADVVYYEVKNNIENFKSVLKELGAL